MPQPRLIAAALALAVFATGPTASAQDAETQARSLFENGVSEMNAGRPAVASEYFERSYQLSPRASSACNMALSLERTNRQCEAIQWYRQCAALDQAGRFRDHANRQAAALGNQCQGGAQAPNPFVSGPATTGTTGSVQVVESQTPQTTTYQGPGPDHTFLVVGIVGLVLGGGALTGAILTADASNSEFNMIVAEPNPEDPQILIEGTADANHYQSAESLRNASIGLGVGAGLLGGLGLIFLIVDLAQPGVFGPNARGSEGPRFVFAPRLDGGGGGEMSLRF